MSKPEWYDQAGKEPFKRNHFHRNLAAGVKRRIGTEKQAPARTRWYWGGVAAAAVVAVVALSSFLSNIGPGHSVAPNQTPAVQTESPTPTSTPSLLSNVPISKDWEKDVKEENVFSSTASNSRWLLLTSEPALGQMGKTLYKSENNGKSWLFVNDVSQIVDGYVTGVAFRDDRNGWISATYHGVTPVPLIRTKDGGKSWSKQEIAIPSGYHYGNVYPPVFKETDVKLGTLKIEFVSDTDKKTVEFQTTDGGETWNSPASADADSIVYTNAQYGFQFALPDRWKGYSIINNKWDGLAMDGDRGEKVVETGPLITIRDPRWTAQTPRQDIPIMVFTLSQWNALQQGEFHIGAAPVAPSELGRNNTYVFALPARYNFAFPPGYEEVDQIMESKPLKATASK
ncbi:WD40/YVTN/BNR-like repeat-containing protein [Paenibacillus sp. HJGM_3]|uniref:WD40/YVTN/BNR-like repeat-containing protein n=1 Tax=Paenibacillus sp. HJGM_3 TaxID=3379816 RepID=UPI003858DDB8